MGYTTDFVGEFDISPPLTEAHHEYLVKFNRTRRMMRDEATLEGVPDPEREAVGLPIGHDGAFFVGSAAPFGQSRSHDADYESITNYNEPPGGRPMDFLRNLPDGKPDFGSYGQVGGRHPQAQPGLWCQWEPNDDGSALRWDGGEKFYYYVEWLEYLITWFLKPWGYTLNGDVSWVGEDRRDIGVISVRDNDVRAGAGKVVFDG